MICTSRLIRANPAGRRTMSASMVDLDKYPISDASFVESCRKKMDSEGICYLPRFLKETDRAQLSAEAAGLRGDAFRSSESHNAYLAEDDTDFAKDHPRNISQASQKRLIAYDQIPESSGLKALYHSSEMKSFVQSVLSLDNVHVSADPMNAVHLNYFGEDDALGWHFDNSEFFVNLLLQRSDGGGAFEYVVDSRTADDPNYDGVADILCGRREPLRVEAVSGSLIIFRGNKSIHRVSPVTDGERITAILTYESEPGVKMNDYTRQKFFGRAAV